MKRRNFHSKEFGPLLYSKPSEIDGEILSYWFGSCKHYHEDCKHYQDCKIRLTNVGDGDRLLNLSTLNLQVSSHWSNC
jgi:hypothetical protein